MVSRPLRLYYKQIQVLLNSKDISFCWINLKLCWRQWWRNMQCLSLGTPGASNIKLSGCNLWIMAQVLYTNLYEGGFIMWEYQMQSLTRPIYFRQAWHRAEVSSVSRLGQHSAHEGRDAEPVHRVETEQPQRISQTCRAKEAKKVSVRIENCMGSIAMERLPIENAIPAYVFVFLQTILWQQGDSNSDRQSKRQGRWPIDHHHGPSIKASLSARGHELRLLAP